MQLHTIRLTAGLLAFTLGTGAAGLSPARRQTVKEPAREAPEPVHEAPKPAPPAATAAVADTAPGETPRVTQTVVTSFPGLGTVRVRAVENFGERMRLEVLNIETDALLASFPAPTTETPEAGAKFGTPFLRFRILRQAGLPVPLILLVAVTPGGSGHGFCATLVAEVGGRLKVLTRESLDTNNQGGVYVGDLGGGRGVGAAVWSPVWDFDSEGHYSAHRFEVTLHPFDSRRKRFVKGRVLKSKRKYGGHGEGALEELRLGYTDLLQDMPDVSEYHWL